MEWIERRKHERFRIRKPAFAAFGSQVWQLGHIIDISKVGLSFRYIAHGARSNGSSALEIYLADKSFHLEKVKFETVWDSELADQLPSSSIPVRRRGVRFEELTQGQRVQLASFIRNHPAALDMRRSRRDRREAYDLDYLLKGGDERRSGEERRTRSSI
jgi:hypothetical protein